MRTVDAFASMIVCVWHIRRHRFFRPTSEAYEDRIKELQDELYADKYNYESWEEIKEEHQKLEATIAELQKED